jgi:hypothetical protein
MKNCQKRYKPKIIKALLKNKVVKMQALKITVESLAEESLTSQ